MPLFQLILVMMMMVNHGDHNDQDDFVPVGGCSRDVIIVLDSQIVNS